MGVGPYDPASEVRNVLQGIASNFYLCNILFISGMVVRQWADAANFVWTPHVLSISTQYVSALLIMRAHQALFGMCFLQVSM